MRKFLIFTISLAALSLHLGAAPLSVEESIQFAFKETAKLKMMRPRQEYTLTIQGREHTEFKERFLRERNAVEIAKSGLSSGCGDFTAVFVHELKESGIDPLIVEGAEISVRSLQFRNSGHSLVAVPSSEVESLYWLVDPSSQKILDKEWSRDSDYFEAYGSTYWIGYVGGMDSYPAHNHQELQEFYDVTIKSIPAELLKECLLSELQQGLNKSAERNE